MFLTLPFPLCYTSDNFLLLLLPSPPTSSSSFSPSSCSSSSSSFNVPTQDMWKFLGQGLNPCYISDSSRSSDNARSLTHCATRDRPSFSLTIVPELFFFSFWEHLLQKLGNCKFFFCPLEVYRNLCKSLLLVLRLKDLGAIPLKCNPQGR